MSKEVGSKVKPGGAGASDVIQPGSERIRSLDAVRGFAVCGILALNIVSMGLPGNAALDPLLYGVERPADMAAWLVNYVLGDGKMRALFTMLFGASMVLIAERAERNGEPPAAVHYRRMLWLFVFGMIHAWFFWYGDILTQYAAAGTLAFALWRWDGIRLGVLFGIMIALLLAFNIGEHLARADVREAAFAPGASSADIQAWQGQQPSPENIRTELDGYRGGFADVFETRKRTTILFQTFLLPLMLPEVIGFMALGILFYRNGFLTGAWPSRAYRRTVQLGYLCAAPLMLPVAWFIASNRFDPALIPLADSASLILRPFIALAHAAAVILLVRSGRLGWLTQRLEATGRMAFSNYLGTTLLTTTLFYGYGFGLFGHLSRAELYLVVLAVWAAILLWSKPWLDQFRYGPLEWLWRSLARAELQPMRRPALAPAA